MTMRFPSRHAEMEILSLSQQYASLTQLLLRTWMCYADGRNTPDPARDRSSVCDLSVSGP